MMDLSIEIENIKVGTFRHIDLAPPVHFNVSFNKGVFTVDNNKYGISISSENLQTVIDEIVSQLKSLMAGK